MPARTGVVLGLKGGYICEVTAVEIIQEIKHLPPEERAKVEDFIAKQARQARQLPGKELARLAETMVDSDDPDEKAALRSEITKGFYGD